MLHIYAETSRTIAFKENTDGSYEWIGEQETFTGPRQFKTADSINNEKIVITYNRVHISGAPTDQVYITYYGDDPRLEEKFDLTLQDIRLILDEWATTSTTPIP